MNLLKALNLYKYSLLSRKGISKLLKISLSLKERKSKVTFKIFSLRLNIRLYNKLSKEVGDFKDSEDGHIYI